MGRIGGTVRAPGRVTRYWLLAVATLLLLLPAARVCRARAAGTLSPPGIEKHIQQDTVLLTGPLSGTQARASIRVTSSVLQWPQIIGVWEARKWNWVLGGAAILTFLSFLWAEILRRRVQNQNRLVQEWARRETALKNRYEELFENANDIVYTTDLNGNVTSCNGAAERVVGYRRVEILGTNILGYVAEEHRALAGQMLNQRQRDEMVPTYPIDIVTRAGRKVPLEVSSRLVYEDGKPAGTQGIARDITERKLFEQMLARREKRLDSFFSTAPAGLAILDNQLRFIRVNETLAQLMKLSPRECVGESLRETTPKLAPVIEPAMRRVLATAQPLVNFLHKGEVPAQPGVTRHFISSYYPIPALEGESCDLAVIVVEVTDRKRAEEALRQSEERLNSILASLREVVWSIAPDGRRFLYLNPATEVVCGLKISEFFQDPDLWLKIIHPDDRKRVVESTDLLEADVDQEFRIVRPDGEVRWLNNRFRAVRDSKSKVIRLDGISIDITDRKQAEQNLKLYKEIFARSNEAVAIIDPDFRFLEQNDAHRVLIGYSDEEIRRLSPAALMGEEDFQNFRKQLWNTSSFRFETILRTRPGRPLDAEISAYSILNNAGDMLCLVGMVRDITERKRTEIERQMAREAAEAANRAKSEFLANMSHEIRTPLNGVLGMTELALNTNLSEEQREYLSLVKSSGETLLTVINDILDFSKIEARRLDINLLDFDLRDSLGDTLKTLSLRAHEKGLELVLHVARDVPRQVEGDTTRLRQVVVNLVGNAIKFTDNGEVVLRVELESRTEKEIVIHFTVTDTGVGIPADKQQTIFAPFTQADSSATRRHGGTGLGLTISLQLVEMMGGRLWMESKEGEGSIFHFTVRFHSVRSEGKSAVPSEEISLKDLPTLVVDDNATNRRLLEEILSSWGMKPAMADGGWTGLAAMQHAKEAGKPFPLVLLDALMPGMDGFALAEHIQEDPGLSGATIMMLTSSGQRGDAARCRELGIAAYLHKPVKERDLLEAVMIALSLERSRTRDAELVTRHTLREGRRNLRVLLAEDDLVNRQLAERLLKKAGHQVTAVSDGSKAVQAIQESGLDGFDVVLMDVKMPETDGLQATAAVRAMETGTAHKLPIIAMTAHAMKGDEERFLKAGMDGYIAKPIAVHALVGLVEQIVQPNQRPASDLHLKSTPREIIDMKRGLAAVDGDSDIFHDLLRLFVRETPAMLNKLGEAVRRKDAAAIEMVARTLRGSVSNFGAEDAVTATLNLEMLARQAKLEQADEAFHAVEKEIRRVLEAIEKQESEVAG